MAFLNIIVKKGSYTVECKVKNANGISDGSITKTFEIEKTIMNGLVVLWKIVNLTCLRE